MSILEFEEPSTCLISYSPCLYTQFIQEKSKFNDPNNLFLVSFIENITNPFNGGVDFVIPVKNLDTLETIFNLKFTKVKGIEIVEGSITCGYHKPSKIYHIYFENLNKTLCFKKSDDMKEGSEIYIDFQKSLISGKFGFSRFDYVVILDSENCEVHFSRFKIEPTKSGFDIMNFLGSSFQWFDNQGEFKDFICTISGNEYMMIKKECFKLTLIYNYDGNLLASLPFVVDNIDDQTGSIVVFYTPKQTFYITHDDWEILSGCPNRTKIIKKFDTMYTSISCQQNHNITLYILKCNDEEYGLKTHIYQLHKNKLYNVCEASDEVNIEIKLLPNGDFEVWKFKQLKNVFRIRNL